MRESSERELNTLTPFVTKGVMNNTVQKGTQMSENDTTAPEQVATAQFECTTEHLTKYYFVDPAYTPYGIHKVLNRIASEQGFKSIPPQMMYNYASNGLIVKGAKGRKQYTQDEAVAFAVKYVGRKLTNKS